MLEKPFAFESVRRDPIPVTIGGPTGCRNFDSLYSYPRRRIDGILRIEGVLLHLFVPKRVLHVAKWRGKRDLRAI